MRFFLTDLGKDPFILGYPFLYAFNLDVDWRAAKLKGGSIMLESVGFQCAQNWVAQCQATIRHCVAGLKEDEAIWVRKLTTVQQWAYEA